MRVIEPRKFDHTKPYRRSKRKYIVGIAVLAFIASAALEYMLITSKDTNSTAVVEDDKTVETALLNKPEPIEEPVEIVVEPPPPPPPVVPEVPTFQIFADNDFKLFYDQLLQPDLLPLENPPEISGNTIADARIRAIAEARGYRLRSSPSVTLSSVDGYPVNARIIQPWLDLKAAAAANGHTMSVVSAYRAVSHQRSLFLSRLAATGATIQQVADGLADDKVDSVLVTSSIPGYSKHHTGYTIDILCAGWQFENFKNSPCNDWITADNYRAAKEHGFIPSYPPGADVQGPDPEAWEYVWVGSDLLLE